MTTCIVGLLPLPGLGDLDSAWSSGSPFCHSSIPCLCVSMVPLAKVLFEWKVISVPAWIEARAVEFVRDWTRLCGGNDRAGCLSDSGDLRPMLDSISSLGRTAISRSRVESEVEDEAVAETARMMVLDFFAECFRYDDNPLMCGPLVAFVGDALGIMTVGLELCEARRFGRSGLSACV
jgi:hypothetical protein